MMMIKRMKKSFVVVLVVVVMLGTVVSADRKKSYSGSSKRSVGITILSKMKKYNANVTWKRVACKHCNGTGSTVKTIYLKHNRIKKISVPCQYCKGRGYSGMSKR